MKEHTKYLLILLTLVVSPFLLIYVSSFFAGSNEPIINVINKVKNWNAAGYLVLAVLIAIAVFWRGIITYILKKLASSNLSKSRLTISEVAQLSHFLILPGIAFFLTIILFK